MKAERKYLAHYLDGNFDTTYANTDYVRIGKDLEELSTELSPIIESSANILGESSVKHQGYEATSSVSPVYFDYDDTLSGKIMEIAMLRKAGDSCKTSYVEVLLEPGATENDEPTVLRAVREDVLLIPTSYGGDTSGVQIPFSINFNGNRTVGTWDIKSKKFTAQNAEL